MGLSGARWRRFSSGDFYVYLVCLVFSFVIWFLIVLSKRYTDDLKCRLEYEKMPGNLIMVSTPVETIKLRLETSGFDLFRYKYLRKDPVLSIDLSTLKLRKENSLYTATLRTSQLTEELERELDLSNVLIDVIPDAIHIDFESAVSRRVPVIPDLTLQFRKQFDLIDTVTVDPDSVVVSGAGNVIEGIDRVFTESRTLKDLSATQALTLPLLPPEKEAVRIKPDEVDVRVPVAEYTEGSVEVEVNVADIGETNYKTFPEKVKLVFLAPLQDYSRIDSSAFEVLAVYDTGITERDKWLPLEVASKPASTKIMRIIPNRVEYIILKEDK